MLTAIVVVMAHHPENALSSLSTTTGWRESINATIGRRSKKRRNDVTRRGTVPGSYRRSVSMPKSLHPDICLATPHSRLVSRRRSCEAEARGHFHQVGQRASLYLSHHVASVRLHGDFADAKLATDLLVQPTGNDQRHHLSFAGGECRVSVPEHPHLRLATQRSTAALEGVPDGVHQYLVAERLRHDTRLIFGHAVATPMLRTSRRVRGRAARRGAGGPRRTPA